MSAPSRSAWADAAQDWRSTANMKAVYEHAEEYMSAEQDISDGLRKLKLFWGEELPNSLKNGGDKISAVSDACVVAFGNVSAAVDDGYGFPLLYDMVDAWGKPGAGYLDVNMYAYGSYDECLKSDLMDYCIGTVQVNYNAIPLPLSLQLAMCVPNGCTPEDIETSINNLTNNNIILHTNASTMICTSEQKQPFNGGAIVMLIVVAIIVGMVIFATAFDYSLVYFESFPTTKEVQVQDSEKSVSCRTPLITKGAVDRKEKLKLFDLITSLQNSSCSFVYEATFSSCDLHQWASRDLHVLGHTWPHPQLDPLEWS